MDIDETMLKRAAAEIGPDWTVDDVRELVKRASNSGFWSGDAPATSQKSGGALKSLKTFIDALPPQSKRRGPPIQQSGESVYQFFTSARLNPGLEPAGDLEALKAAGQALSEATFDLFTSRRMNPGMEPPDGEVLKALGLGGDDGQMPGYDEFTSQRLNRSG